MHFSQLRYAKFAATGRNQMALDYTELKHRMQDLDARLAHLRESL